MTALHDGADQGASADAPGRAQAAARRTAAVDRRRGPDASHSIVNGPLVLGMANVGALVSAALVASKAFWQSSD